MRTAIIITGAMRSFDACLPRLIDKVFRHFEPFDFFVSTVQDEDAHKAEALKRAFPNSRVEIEIVPEQPDCIADLRAKGCQLPTRWELGKPYMREKYWISVHPQAVARQLWQLERGWKLFNERAGSDADSYRAFVRCRPDLLMHSLDASELGNPLSSHAAFTPFWGRFDGVNDRFAVLGSVAAQAYFTTYSQIPAHLSRGGDLHPETLVRRSLEHSRCNIRDTLGVLFSTKRSNGEIRPPEIIGDDIVHLAASA